VIGKEPVSIRIVFKLHHLSKKKSLMTKYLGSKVYSRKEFVCLGALAFFEGYDLRIEDIY
jgi:hypothetical protein